MLHIVETEFLFGLRTGDRWYNHAMRILELFKLGRIETLQSCASAFLEVATVLQSHGVQAERIEEALFLMKQKLAEYKIGEVELSSDDIIRMYELLRRYDIEYFDAMQAAVALGRNAVLVTNDEVFTMLGIKTIPFEELTKTEPTDAEVKRGQT